MMSKYIICVVPFATEAVTVGLKEMLSFESISVIPCGVPEVLIRILFVCAFPSPVMLNVT